MATAVPTKGHRTFLYCESKGFVYEIGRTSALVQSDDECTFRMPRRCGSGIFQITFGPFSEGCQSPAERGIEGIESQFRVVRIHGEL